MTGSNPLPMGPSFGKVFTGQAISAPHGVDLSGKPVLGLDQTQMSSKDDLDLTSKTEQKNAEKQSKQAFSVIQAAKNFLKGVVSPVTALIQHPLMAIGALALGIGACTLVPALVPVMVVGFGGLSLYQGAKGVVSAVQHYQKGEYEKAEHAFEEIGAGAVGTGLSFVGIRGVAAITAESKAAYAATKLGKSAEEIAQLTKVAAEQANKLTVMGALKESATIISTAEGRGALFSQLKPSTISGRIASIRAARKKPASNEVNVNKQSPKLVRTDEEIAAFKASPEGIRRSKMSKADIQKEAEAIYQHACEQLGIPKELRPKFHIDDELKHLDPAELQKLAKELYVKETGSRTKNGGYVSQEKPDQLPDFDLFKPGEHPSQFDSATLKSKIIEAAEARIKANGYEGGPIDSKMVSVGSPDYIGGGHVSHEHRIKFHANTYRHGIFTLEEIVVHEGRHAQQAFLRARLSPAERAKAVQEQLFENILAGESEQIILRGSVMGPEFMCPPHLKQYPELAKSYIQLLEQEVLPNVAKWSGDFNASYLSTSKRPCPTESLERLAQLKDKLSKLIEASPEFINGPAGKGSNDIKSMETAVKSLLEYTEAQCTRYQMFSHDYHPTDVLDAMKKFPLSDLERDYAAQSLKEYIACVEGNARNQSFGNQLFGSVGARNQYQFSPEELYARNTAAHYERVKLGVQKESLQSQGKLTPELEAQIADRLKLLELEMKRNQLGEQMYEAYNKVRLNPEDASAKAVLETLEKSYQQVMDTLTGKGVDVQVFAEKWRGAALMGELKYHPSGLYRNTGNQE
jgi:hypothetical protein